MKPKIIHVETQSMDETVIKVAGIHKPLTIMHVTDSHLAEVDERDEETVCRAAKHRQKLLGEGHATTYFEAAIRRSNEWQVDCTVFTGDIIDFPSERNIDLMEQQFRQLRAPYLFTLGNHDWHFSHFRSNDRIREKMYPLFERFTRGNPSHQAFDVEGVRLIVMDNSNYQFSAKQLDFVKVQLAGNMPCLLFFHIPLYLSTLATRVKEVWKSPIMVDAEGWDEEARKKWGVRETDSITQEFRRFIVSGESSNLAAIFCGHVHFANKDTFAMDRYQYVTHPGFKGGYRKIMVQPL